MFDKYTYKKHADPFGLSGCFVEYMLSGFERPCDGDRAIITALISLPANGKALLRDDYVYGPDVMFFGRPLVEDWGESRIQGFKTADMQIKADTVKEGFEAIKAEVVPELQKLSEIVKARRSRIDAKNGDGNEK